MLQELLDITHLFLVIIPGQLIIGMFRQIIFIRHERAHTAQLQNTFFTIKYLQFIDGEQIFATMSSDEFKNKNCPPILTMSGQ